MYNNGLKCTNKYAIYLRHEMNIYNGKKNYVDKFHITNFLKIYL